MVKDAGEQAALECEWPSFRGSNSEFWGHEWGELPENVRSLAGHMLAVALAARYEQHLLATGCLTVPHCALLCQGSWWWRQL